MDDGAMTGLELSETLSLNPECPVRINFAGMSIPVIAAIYRREGNQVILEVDSLWTPDGWFLEERKDRPDQKHPKPDPGSP